MQEVQTFLNRGYIEQLSRPRYNLNYGSINSRITSHIYSLQLYGVWAEPAHSYVKAWPFAYTILCGLLNMELIP